MIDPEIQEKFRIYETVISSMGKDIKGLLTELWILKKKVERLENGK